MPLAIGAEAASVVAARTIKFFTSSPLSLRHDAAKVPLKMATLSTDGNGKVHWIMATRLTPNGFGRWQQTIVLHVPDHHSRTVSDRLGLMPFKKEDAPERSFFEWRRPTVRPGNDEDVVWDLAERLNDSRNELEWIIDWQSSNF